MIGVGFFKGLFIINLADPLLYIIAY